MAKGASNSKLFTILFVTYLSAVVLGDLSGSQYYMSEFHSTWFWARPSEGNNHY